MKVYIAQHLSAQSDPFELHDILTVQDNFIDLEIFVMNYFGINPNKHYEFVPKYLGFTKIEYSEYEDDVIGYFNFEETYMNPEKLIDKVYVLQKELNEKN